MNVSSASARAHLKKSLQERLMENMKTLAAERESGGLMTPGSIHGLSEWSDIAEEIGPIQAIRSLPSHLNIAGGGSIGKGAMKLGSKYIAKAVAHKVKRQICRMVCY
ncbi:MAG: hypothetical protein PHY47_00705 [Lachnospiraceae bacterium]|nr:hypothetical protein [Lachnospiraceae bacterium]